MSALTVSKDEEKRLKGQGFLNNRGTDEFSARVITVNGKVTAAQHRCMAEAAEKFGNGNLTYTIPVDSEDEMGYLSHSLNYMADKLNKNGEYQRQFISNVSHDFRSPLTSIKGYVEAMLDGTIPVEMQEKYLKIISFEAERLEKLTRSLLTLNELDVKKRMMHMRRFDINETIRTTAASFEGTCSERNIRLELLLAGKELFVRADMEQIQQVQ